MVEFVEKLKGIGQHELNQSSALDRKEDNNESLLTKLSQER